MNSVRNMYIDSTKVPVDLYIPEVNLNPEVLDFPKTPRFECLHMKAPGADPLRNGKATV